jgi:hypothetical protein
MDLAHHNRSCASPLTASTDAGYRRAEFFFHWSRRNKLGYDLLLDISKDGAGVSREPPVKTSTESLRQFDNFCSANQSYDSHRAIIDPETDFTFQEVAINPRAIPLRYRLPCSSPVPSALFGNGSSLSGVQSNKICVRRREFQSDDSQR